MSIKVSDYVVNFFAHNNIFHVFTITGGFAMHLNDSFGKDDRFNKYYMHHEQACGYAAVGYTKLTSKPCLVITTAGCAATNAISPCLVAHQDSLPVLFISGQVKSNEAIRTINNKKMKLRHYAGADSDIISMVEPITKYAYEINNIHEINDVLMTAYNHLITGRPGPVWLSIPVDIQGMLIDNKYKCNYIEKPITNINLNEVEVLLSNAKRPLIIAGNGIKLGNCINKFNNFINKYKIPVVVTMLSTDVIETNNDYYAGKIGLIGDRHGNFTLQNCDLLISLGCRMAQGIVGYRSDWFARAAKIIYIDNDENELEKTNLNYTLKINMDLNTFFDYNFNHYDYTEWINKCKYWKNKWIFEMPDCNDNNGINPYYTLKMFYDMAPENKVTLCSSGSIVTNIWHMINIKKGDKLLISSQGDMGFELPASIGALVADPNKMIISMLGEGSFQLNIQELQTIVQYKIPIKILLFNNASYGAIKITQENFFKNKFGVDISSGISFPETQKIAYAYGIKYLSASKNIELEQVLKEFIECKEAIICEIFSCIQTRYPDGTFTNRPYEDMDPFMDREELKKEMIIDIV